MFNELKRKMCESIDKNLTTIGKYLFDNGQINEQLRDEIFLVCIQSFPLTTNNHIKYSIYKD